MKKKRIFSYGEELHYLCLVKILLLHIYYIYTIYKNKVFKHFL